MDITNKTFVEVLRIDKYYAHTPDTLRIPSAIAQVLFRSQCSTPTYEDKGRRATECRETTQGYEGKGDHGPV